MSEETFLWSVALLPVQMFEAPFTPGSDSRVWKLVTLPLASCHTLSSCSACISSPDPMCQWCPAVGKCSAALHCPSATVSVCPEKNGPPSPASMSIDDPRNISLPVKHLPQPDGFCDGKETMNPPKSPKHHAFRRTCASSAPSQVLQYGPRRERPAHCPAHVPRADFLPLSLNCWCSPHRPVRAPLSSTTLPSTTVVPSEPALRAALLRPAATGVPERTDACQEEAVQRLDK
ncbi:plexin repeat-containing domain protein [Ancylostoma caninum]|uniref:Plexin repeat-containing domain protein n=1 Tax=Ancylostoma caninum TaxID=29170 RepID=A0A368FPW6_ANCCA|nr:plexin repeat-containing domain protein [Ancylostoma caninum]